METWAAPERMRRVAALASSPPLAIADGGGSAGGAHDNLSLARMRTDQRAKKLPHLEDPKRNLVLFSPARNAARQHGQDAGPHQCTRSTVGCRRYPAALRQGVRYVEQLRLNRSTEDPKREAAIVRKIHSLHAKVQARALGLGVARRPSSHQLTILLSVAITRAEKPSYAEHSNHYGTADFALDS